MRRWCIVLMVVVVFGLTGSAFAEVVALTFDNSGTLSYQQTENSPCVFGHSGQGAGSGGCKMPLASIAWPNPVVTPTGGSDTMPWCIADNGANPPVCTEWSEDTQVISAASIFDVLGSNSFVIAIDVNQAGPSPIQMTLLDVYQGTTLIAQLAVDPTALLPSVQGNGWSDAFSQQAVSFDENGDDITFVWNFENNSDGFETLFLTWGEPTVVPEPISIVLLGTVLVGIGAWQRKRTSAKN